MVVEGRNLFNLRKQALVNLLKVRAGEGTGLGARLRCEAHRGAGERK
jgi:hypothetical protein